MSDWQVEQLRLTVFPLQDLREPTPDWWAKIVGAEPEIKTVQKGVAVREAGPIKNGYCNLVLQIQGPRIDWLAAAVHKGNEPLKGFLTFDNLKGALTIFQELLAPWLNSVPSFKRIGFGAVLVMPVESREVGYKTVSRYLPAVKLDPTGSSDFSYSINRPRASKSVDGLKINRLSRWAVVQVQEFHIQGSVPGAVAIVEGAADFQSVRAELDVNTAAERSDPLPKDLQASVFHELVALAEEMAARGDVP